MSSGSSDKPPSPAHGGVASTLPVAGERSGHIGVQKARSLTPQGEAFNTVSMLEKGQKLALEIG